jgi:hypothetical protein
MVWKSNIRTPLGIPAIRPRNLAAVRLVQYLYLLHLGILIDTLDDIVQAPEIDIY